MNHTFLQPPDHPAPDRPARTRPVRIMPLSGIGESTRALIRLSLGVRGVAATAALFESAPGGAVDRATVEAIARAQDESGVPLNAEEEAGVEQALARHSAAELACRQLYDASERLFARTASRAGVSVDAARLVAHYSPAQLRRMAGLEHRAPGVRS